MYLLDFFSRLDLEIFSNILKFLLVLTIMAALVEEADDFERFLKQGKTLGFSGAELTQYVKDCQARDERAREREVEKEKNLLAAESEKRKVNVELEKARLYAETEKRKCDLEMKRLESQPDVPNVPTNSGNNPHMPKLPPFKEDKDDIDAFIFRFESHAEACNWDRAKWPICLASTLNGSALALYHSLCAGGPVVYDDLKMHLLMKFQCTENGFRERFRDVRPDSDESFLAFLKRASHFLDRWIAMSETAKTFDGLRDLIIREQILHSCCRDLAVFLRERKFTDAHSMCEAANQYKTAHPGKSMARKSEVSIFTASAAVANNTGNQGQQNHTNGNRYQRGQSRGFPRQSNSVSDSKTDQTWSSEGANSRGQSFRGHRGNGRGRRYGRGQSNGSTGQQADTLGIVCYNCQGLGHKSPDCPSPKFKKADSQVGQVACEVLISAFAQNEHAKLHLVKGTVGNAEVSVLRDTGCTTAGVRQSLVLPEQYTGKTQQCVTFGGRIEVFDLAVVKVVTPYYSGDLLCCVIEDPVADLILGNVVGVSEFESPSTGVGLVTTRLQSAKEKVAPKPLDTATVPDLNVSKDDLIRLQLEDPKLLPLFDKAKQGVVQKSGEDHFSYIVEDGILYRRFSHGNSVSKQILVPSSLQQSVLCVAHDGIMAGHCGIRRTLQRVLSNFFWPGVRCAVKRYCRTCDICQKTVSKGRVPCVPLEKMPVIQEPFKRIAIDLVGPFQPVSANGYRYVLTIVDVATRYPEAVPLKKIDTVSVAEALVSVFARMGCPEEILSDCGTQFVSDLMKEIFRLLSIKSVHTSPYHAQSNGLVERFNGTLKTMLRRVIQSEPKHWDRYIPPLLFAYRELPNESTGFSPFELLFGRRARGPMDILAKSWTGQTDSDEAKPLYQYVFDLKNTLKDACSLAQENAQVASEKHKHYHDLKAVPRSFQVDDEVLVLLPSDSNKLLMTWKGPFRVTECFGCDYRVEMSGKKKVFHANMLKRYERRSSCLSVVTQEVHVEDQAVGLSIPAPSPLFPFQDAEEVGFQDSKPCLMFDSDPASSDGNGVACSYHVSCEPALVAVLQSEESGQIELPTLPSGGKETIADIQFDNQLDAQSLEEMKSVFEEFSECLTDEPGDVVESELHEINLTTENPVRMKQYPLPFASRQTVEKEVKNMLDMGVIEPSKSAYCSPVLLVPKKDGSVRFCIDFRALNKVTVFDSEPIPDTEELFCRLAGAHFFTKIDLSRGYWQIRVRPEDRHKTAFQTSLGLFQWVKMPFGMVTAPATFARMMRHLALEENSALNFFDDILVASVLWEDHLVHVRSVLEKLKQFGLTARPSKVHAGFRELEFLGHIVGQGVLKPEKSKVEKILAISKPVSKKQVKSLLGLVGYYRRYVPGFSSITAPLSDLTRAGGSKQITWTEECERSLRVIQNILAKFPILLLPDLSKEFLVRTDASSTGLGAVLLQEHDGLLHPVCFVSRKLLDRESRYSTIERECLAIVWSLTKLYRYLWGREFVLQTDHKPLLFLNSGQFRNSRVMRWSLALQEFRFKVEPVSGESNILADMLSRSVSEQVVP